MTDAEILTEVAYALAEDPGFASGLWTRAELLAYLNLRQQRFLKASKVVKRPPESEGFVKLPKRWVAERSFAWFGRDRRHSRDYEWHTSSSEAWLRISSIRGMLNRLAPKPKEEQPPFMYKKRATA